MIIKPNKANLLFMWIIGNLSCIFALFGSVLTYLSLTNLSSLVVTPSYNTIKLITVGVFIISVLFMAVFNYMLYKGATKQTIHVTGYALRVYEAKSVLHEIAIKDIESFEYTHYGAMDISEDTSHVNYRMYLVKTATNADFELSTGLYDTARIHELVKYCQNINPSIQNNL